MTARERLAPLAARLRAALADEKQRVNLLVCMGLVGLLLLAVSSWLPADSSTQSAAPAAMTDSTADYAAELETRLTALISRVEGAGKTAVMVTLESGSESIYATTPTATAAPPMYFWAAARRTALWRPSRRPACSASPLSARAAAVLPCRAASPPWCRH